MAESLRDQLLKSGLVKEIREEKRKPAPPARQGGNTSASGQPYAGDRPKQGGKPHGGGERPEPRAVESRGGRRPPRHAGKRRRRRRGQRPRRVRGKDGEIDLAKAYAIRAQNEAARAPQGWKPKRPNWHALRKEKKRKVEELLKGKALNLARRRPGTAFPVWRENSPRIRRYRAAGRLECRGTRRRAAGWALPRGGQGGDRGTAGASRRSSSR